MNEESNRFLDGLRGELGSFVGLALIAVIGWLKGFFKKKAVESITKEKNMEEKKALEFKIEDEFMLLSVDPNKDGEKLIELKVALKEVPDEVLSALKKD